MAAQHTDAAMQCTDALVHALHGSMDAYSQSEFADMTTFDTSSLSDGPVRTMDVLQDDLSSSQESSDVFVPDTTLGKHGMKDDTSAKRVHVSTASDSSRDIAAPQRCTSQCRSAWDTFVARQTKRLKSLPNISQVRNRVDSLKVHPLPPLDDTVLRLREYVPWGEFYAVMSSRSPVEAMQYVCSLRSVLSQLVHRDQIQMAQMNVLSKKSKEVVGQLQSAYFDAIDELNRLREAANRYKDIM